MEGYEDKQGGGEAVDEEHKGEDPPLKVEVHLVVRVLECHRLLHWAIAVDQARQKLTGQAWFFFTK